MTGNPFFNYDIDSLSFLERAQQQLKLFDKEEDISRLLYAALELRMGIESKLYESLDAAYSANNKRSVLQKEYQSKKLLAELLKMCPEAEEDYVLVVKKTGSRDGFGFRFTPITRTLAKRHGELGELLHFSLFKLTIEWYIKDPVDVDSRASLKPRRRFLENVCKELEKCNSGDLILPITWRPVQNRNSKGEPVRVDVKKTRKE